MTSLMARMRERILPQPPIELPGITGQLRFVDEAGHTVTAYRRGRNSWALDHTSRSGCEVLRFFSTAQLVRELHLRSAIPIEVTSALPS